VTAPSTLGAVVTREAGTNRISTAIAVSQASFPDPGSAGAAVVTCDDGFADALTGTPLAVAKDAPILLTDPSALDAATQAEIQRVLSPGGTVYLLGGTGSVSPAVATTISALGYQVVRYAGPDRYATAVAIANALGDPTTILLADGTTYPDALSAGSAAAKAGGAVLLTDGTTIPTETAAYLAAHPSDTVYAVGGPALAADPTAAALSGPDRYATAVAVADQFFPKPATVGLASGADYPDALTGGAATGLAGAPLLLTDPDTLSPETSAYLQSVAPTLTAVDVYGGPAAIDNTVITAAEQTG
jgi:putative cell wall-binding protein